MGYCKEFENKFTKTKATGKFVYSTLLIKNTADYYCIIVLPNNAINSTSISVHMGYYIRGLLVFERNL